jgi:hypothetical protein
MRKHCGQGNCQPEAMAMGACAKAMAPYVGVRPACSAMRKHCGQGNCQPEAMAMGACAKAMAPYVGVRGIEPPASRSRTGRSTDELHSVTYLF